MNDVLYPYMRDEVIGAIRTLAAPEYQWKLWVQCDEVDHPDYYDCFNTVVHILYDDTAVFLDELTSIGSVLQNEQELASLHVLRDVLNNLFDTYGLDLLDDEYPIKPEWQDVVRAAQETLQILTSPDG